MRKIVSTIMAAVLCCGMAACDTGAGNANLEPAEIRIASMKGPTTMGMVKLMSNSDNGMYEDKYSVELYGTADEIVTGLVKGEIDVANVPCNLASALYNKTNGGISVACINTMGVLYVVESGESISAIGDLVGKTIYSTGKGTTPEFAFNYILKQNGINPDTDLDIQYKSESTEVTAILQNDESAIAVLPQPYITIASAKNDKLRMALSLMDEWEKVSDNGSLVTGVTVVRNEFLEANGAAFERFMKRYSDSVEFALADEEKTATLIGEYDIVPRSIAIKALPYCSISMVTGNEMKQLIEGYLNMLFDSEPSSIGGKLPENDFYFIGE